MHSLCLKSAVSLGHNVNEIIESKEISSIEGSSLQSFSDTHSARKTEKSLYALIEHELPEFSEQFIALEHAKINTKRVDGVIIGTGEADFTKGNTLYTLNHKGKTFQLMDVPGIEGDEEKYEQLVKTAVAKSHLVFYVNGTNKKPEKKTAEKIEQYLRIGSQVFALCNIRGSADAYEFEEDRTSLTECHGNSEAAMEQTLEVLRNSLREGALIGGTCVQGLLGFTSLAHDGFQTTIDASRENDLVRQQNNYLKWFDSTETMREFSQIDGVSKVINGKLSTFKEDIVQSNKDKVNLLLQENIKTLYAEFGNYKMYVDTLKPEFEKCYANIDGAVDSFEREVHSTRKNHLNDFFNKLCDCSDDLVEEHYGDDDTLEYELECSFRRLQSNLGSGLNL